MDGDYDSGVRNSEDNAVVYRWKARNEMRGESTGRSWGTKAWSFTPFIRQNLAKAGPPSTSREWQMSKKAV